jgi:hypothetical protein
MAAAAAVMKTQLETTVRSEGSEEAGKHIFICSNI